MKLLKPNLKLGMYAILLSGSFAFMIRPLAYDNFGLGARITKEVVLSSENLREDCGEINTFIIIPWKLSIFDSSRSGKLQIGYWFRCGGSFSFICANYYHHGEDWIAEKIEVHAHERYYDLTKVSPQYGHPNQKLFPYDVGIWKQLDCH